MADDEQREEDEDAGGISDDALAEVFEEEAVEEEVEPAEEPEEVSLDEMAEKEDEDEDLGGFDDVDNF